MEKSRDTILMQKAILSSEIYLAGRTFLTTEMEVTLSSAVGRNLKDREASIMLYQMKREGLLDSFMSDKKRCKWFRPMSKQLSTPWRTQSNAALGIIEQAGPVEWARHGA